MTKKQVDQLIEGIYDGSITEYNIPEPLYYMIAERLRKGLYEGFGQTLADVATEDKALLTALRTNVYQFSAAKSYQEIKAMSGLLADTQVFSEFKKEAKAKYDVFNDTYLKTEYDTAIGQAQMVVKWQEIEKTKDVLPYLRYSAIVDPNTSEICLPLDGIVATVDDPIWDKVSPLNHFNCRCLLLQEFDAVPTEGREQIATEVEKDMQDMFKQNPAKTGMIFDKSHPYFKVASEDREFARQNFGLPIPKTDSTPSNFVPLNSVNEVERFLVDNNIVTTVALGGTNLESANAIAQTLSELTQEYKINKLDFVSNKIKSTSQALAHANSKLIEFNNGFVSKPPTPYNVADLALSREKRLATLAKFEKAKAETPDLFDSSHSTGRKNTKALNNVIEGLKFSRWTVTQRDIVRTVTHEYAHVLEQQYFTTQYGVKSAYSSSNSNLPKEIGKEILDDFRVVSAKIMKSEDKYLISEYAMSEPSELWAELFTMYRFEPDAMPDYAREFMETTLEKFKTHTKIK